VALSWRFIITPPPMFPFRRIRHQLFRGLVRRYINPSTSL
jgi:hypothetical protein